MRQNISGAIFCRRGVTHAQKFIQKILEILFEISYAIRNFCQNLEIFNDKISESARHYIARLP